MGWWEGWKSMKGVASNRDHYREGILEYPAICGARPPMLRWEELECKRPRRRCSKCERALLLRTYREAASQAGYLLRCPRRQSVPHAVRPTMGLVPPAALCGHQPTGWRPGETDRVCTRCRCLVLALPLYPVKKPRTVEPLPPTLPFPP